MTSIFSLTKFKTYIHSLLQVALAWLIASCKIVVVVRRLSATTTRTTVSSPFPINDSSAGAYPGFFLLLGHGELWWDYGGVSLKRGWRRWRAVFTDPPPPPSAFWPFLRIGSGGKWREREEISPGGAQQLESQKPNCRYTISPGDVFFGSEQANQNK